MVSINTFASVGSRIAFRRKGNTLTVEWNFDSSNVADCQQKNKQSILGQINAADQRK
jgi:hypothetical protein